MSQPADLEPAERDPKKLRRTAWILVAIMIAGGLLVLRAYETWAAKQAVDTRPAIIHRIQKERDLRLLRQDGKTADLFDLRGKVFVLNVLSLRDPQTAARSMAVMKRLAEKHAGDEDFRLVTLVIDPLPAEQLHATLAKTSETHGMTLPQWWMGGNEPGTLHKFIKNELKASVYPNEANGQWDYDPAIVLIDRDGHVRRAVVPQTRNGKPAKPQVLGFDFDKAAGWDAAGMKSGTDRSNETELEILLERTIDALLAETPESR
jgi:cytochrome oxidase Cu insertion factor (SCO1/SenC/PrrC family)